VEEAEGVLAPEPSPRPLSLRQGEGTRLWNPVAEGLVALALAVFFEEAVVNGGF